MNLLNSINNSMKQIEGTLECVPAELKHWTADIVQEPISSWKNTASINQDFHYPKKSFSLSFLDPCKITHDNKMLYF